MGSEMKTSVLLGLFLLASLSLSRDVHLHLSLPEGSKLLSVDPGSETMTINQDYSGSDPMPIPMPMPMLSVPKCGIVEMMDIVNHQSSIQSDSCQKWIRTTRVQRRRNVRLMLSV